MIQQQSKIQMGGIFTSQIQYKVATLNYSGILLSPFEFVTVSNQNDEEHEEIQQLNNIFVQLLRKELASYNILFENKQELQNKFRWKIGDIDRKMQKGRYSPLYRIDAGIYYNRLMSRSQFQLKWQEEYNKNERYTNFKKDDKHGNEEIKNCMLLDFLCYKTFVEYIYKKIDPSIQVNLLDRNLNSSRQDRENRKKALAEYEQFMWKYFSKSFINQQKKIAIVKQIFKDHDILFLQDVSDELINSLKNQKQINIVTSKAGDCAIILKQRKFRKLYNEQLIFEQFSKHQEYKNLLSQKLFDYYEGKSNTAVCFVDNFILISAHLTSGQNKKSQGTQLLKHIYNIKKKLNNCHIIVGCDFNNFIQDYEIIEQLTKDKNFNYYPDNRNQFTTKKTRTWLQPQISKAEKRNEDCRDHLITDLKMKRTKVQTAKGKITNWIHFLPNNDHPFDHFLISAILKV